MAKAKTGLPEGFDIAVTSSDLAGPARLPGYLDDDPVVEFARIQKQQRAAPTEKENRPSPSVTVSQERIEAVIVPTVKAAPEAKPPSPPAPQSVLTHPRPPRRRLQINLDPESERMVEELLDLVSNQSSEHRIKISELIQALVLNLYNARSEISLGSLPQRGRWGSPTAKSFPASLAQAFREALVAHDQSIGGNQFKKVAGR